MRRALALTLSCLPVFAHADCTAQLAGWAQQLHPQRDFSQRLSVCKVSPADPTRTLAALVFVEGEDSHTADYGLDVLVAREGVIERHLYQEAAISSDAIRFEELSLDTARYNLAPDVRAFGVRMYYSGSSRVNPFSSTLLNLYVEDGGTLRKVLDELEVARSGGEWDGACEGEFYDTRSSLAIGKASQQGYAVLEITDKNTASRSIGKAGDCRREASAPTSSKSVLTYDGKHYEIPRRAMSRWWSGQ